MRPEGKKAVQFDDWEMTLATSESTVSKRKAGEEARSQTVENKVRADLEP